MSSVSTFRLVPLTCLAPALFCTHRNIPLKPVRIANTPSKQQPEREPHSPSAREPEPNRPKPEQEEPKPQRKKSSTNKHQPSPNVTLTGLRPDGCLKQSLQRRRDHQQSIIYHSEITRVCVFSSTFTDLWPSPDQSSAPVLIGRAVCRVEAVSEGAELQPVAVETKTSFNSL